MDAQALFGFEPSTDGDNDLSLAATLEGADATSVPFPDPDFPADDTPAPILMSAPIHRPTLTAGPATETASSTDLHAPHRRPIEVPATTVTVGDLADQAGVTEQAILKQIHAGAIHATRIGRRWAISEHAAQDYLHRHSRRRTTHPHPAGGAPQGTVPATAGTQLTPAAPAPTSQLLDQLQQENYALKEQLRLAKATLANMGTLLNAS